jgi:hypothetical protein
MKRLTILLLPACLACLLMAMAVPAQAADAYLQEQGYYLGKDFPSQEVIQFNYDEAWLDVRSKAPLRVFFKLLGKEKTGEDQYKVYLHYKRPEANAVGRDDIIIKKLDTDIWLMTERSAGSGSPESVGSRIMKRLPGN